MPVKKGGTLIRGNDVARFWSKTEQVGDCIVWTGRLDRAGRGKFMTGPSGGQTTHVPHRWIYERVCGPIPSGMYILHECDNGACVAIQHHSIGTQKLNMEQMVRRGRLGSRATINEEIADDIRRTLSSGMSVADAARHHGVSYMVAYDIARRKTWNR